jgi:phenylacetate-CoA ligase
VLDLTPDPASLDPIETASIDELRSLQLERLRWSLGHAYANVPHHRAAFDAAGVHPDDLADLSDLARFPFTAKQDLRDTYPFGMFAVPREQVSRIHASSGTTGKPTVVGYTARDVDTWSDVVARSLRASGVRPGWTVHVAYGYGLFTGGLGAHYGAERLGCTVIPVSGGMTERQVQLLVDLAPDAICVTPSYVLSILDQMRAQGVDPRGTSLKVGVFGAEPWTEAMRQEVEDAFDVHAVDIYGLSEVIGPGVANECVEVKDGLHVWEDHFYPEIVDPETGAVLPDGEEGELVFTSLTKEAMPVIRYRTRDLTRLLPGTARSMRRMEKVTGRTDDMLIVRGVNVFPSAVREVVGAFAPHVSGHILVRPRDEGVKQEPPLPVSVELARGVIADAALAAAIRERLRSVLTVQMRVELVPWGSLGRSEYKSRLVDPKI